MLWFYKANRGFVGINRDEEVLFQLMQHGREPDFPREGVFRIVVDDKIGFANLDGEIVVPPVYDMVLPFNEGVAAYCENCGTDRSGLSAKWSNGTWGFIDKTGEVVIKPQFQDVRGGFKNDKAKVKLKDEWIFIDKNGQKNNELGIKKRIFHSYRCITYCRFAFFDTRPTTHDTRKITF